MKENSILIRQIIPTIRMFNNILELVDDDFLKKEINGSNAGKMIYHPMYWFHKHLTFDGDFNPPGFHSENLFHIEIKDNQILSKKELKNYLVQIEQDVIKQVSDINPLTIVIGTVTVLDKIIGQVRHSCHHIGMLHLLLFQESAVWPEYIGPDF